MLFIVLILAIPVVISFEYGKGIRLRVRYLFLTLYRIPAKPKKAKEKKKKADRETEDVKAEQTEELSAEAAPVAPAEVAAEAEQKDGKKAKKEKKKKEKKPKDPKIPTLPEIFELVKVFVDSLCKPLKKLLKRIKICDFDIRMICGGSDAAKAALKFGAMNLVVGNALGFFDSFFTLKAPHVDINVDFQSEETETEFSCTVKMCAMIFLMFVFTFLGRLIVRVLRSDKIKGWLGRLTGKNKKKKKAKKQVVSEADKT